MQIAAVVFIATSIIATVVWLFRLGHAALGFYRNFETLAMAALERAVHMSIADACIRQDRVVVVYHTYHGFFCWVTSVEHRRALPPPNARRLLVRLLRFNLTWGLLAAGGLFVIPTALCNYFLQRASIAKQERALGQRKVSGTNGTAA